VEMVIEDPKWQGKQGGEEARRQEGTVERD
jgi:hypothetical protein